MFGQTDKTENKFTLQPVALERETKTQLIKKERETHSVAAEEH